MLAHGLEYGAYVAGLFYYLVGLFQSVLVESHVHGSKELGWYTARCYNKALTFDSLLHVIYHTLSSPSIVFFTIKIQDAELHDFVLRAQNYFL